MSTKFTQPDDYGLWRFGIISPLLHRTDDAPPLFSQIEQLSQRTFYTPDGREKQIRPATLRTWLSRYHNQGIDGLRNKPRTDNRTTSVPGAIGDALVDMRKHRSVCLTMIHSIVWQPTLKVTEGYS